jgi:hypothetical protein
MKKKLRMQILYNCLLKILGWLVYTCLHPLLGAGGLSGDSWQLVTACHDEGDVWYFVSECHDIAHIIYVSFGIVETDTIVVRKVLLWSFLDNLSDIYCIAAILKFHLKSVSWWTLATMSIFYCFGGSLWVCHLIFLSSVIVPFSGWACGPVVLIITCTGAGRTCMSQTLGIQLLISFLLVLLCTVILSRSDHWENESHGR